MRGLFPKRLELTKLSTFFMNIFTSINCNEVHLINSTSEPGGPSISNYIFTDAQGLKITN